MAHDIHNGMFVGAIKSSWHMIGVYEFDGWGVDAVRRVGADYSIFKIRKRIEAPNLGIDMDADDFALVRESYVRDGVVVPAEHIGSCSADYSYYQNVEFADLSDAIAQQAGWRFSTMGVLGKGETIFLCYDAGKRAINGDDHENYVVFIEERNGSAAGRIVASQINVVCRNTMIAAESSGWGVKVVHGAWYRQEVDYVARVIAGMHRQIESSSKRLEILPDIRFSEQRMRRLAEELFPYVAHKEAPFAEIAAVHPDFAAAAPPSVAQRVRDRASRDAINARRREGLMAQYDAVALSLVRPEHHHTGWHAYQAVTSYITHEIGAESRRQWSPIQRAVSDVMGVGAALRARALNFILRTKDAD